MKIRLMCECPCVCPVPVIDEVSEFCEWCKGGQHWKKSYDMNWAKWFAALVLVFMAIVLAVWLATGY